MAYAILMIVYACRARFHSDFNRFICDVPCRMFLADFFSSPLTTLTESFYSVVRSSVVQSIEQKRNMEWGACCYVCLNLVPINSREPSSSDFHCCWKWPRARKYRLQFHFLASLGCAATTLYNFARENTNQYSVSNIVFYGRPCTQLSCKNTIEMQFILLKNSFILFLWVLTYIGRLY